MATSFRVWVRNGCFTEETIMGTRSKPTEAEANDWLIAPDLLHAYGHCFGKFEQRILRVAGARARSLCRSGRIILTSADIIYAAKRLCPSIVAELERDLQKVEQP